MKHLEEEHVGKAIKAITPTQNAIGESKFGKHLQDMYPPEENQQDLRETQQEG